MITRSVVLMVSLAASGCSAGADSWQPGSDGGPSADLGANPFDLGPACSSISIMSTSDIVPSTLTARTNAIGSGPHWTVDTPTGQKVPAALDGSGLIVFSDATDPGTYIFRLHLDTGDFCIGQASKVVDAPNGNSDVYTLRVTPPASVSDPQQETSLVLKGGTEQLDRNIVLAAGTPLAATLTSPTGPIAGEVDLLPLSGPQLRFSVGANGAFTFPVAFANMYRVLLLPVSSAWAPQLIGPYAGAMLFSTSFAVDAGEPIAGSVTDESDAALSGAHVALHAGALASGLGISASDGKFTLRAAREAYTLSVSAPQRPDLSLASVVVPAGGANIVIKHLLARVAVTPRVVATDGTTVVSNTVVTLTSGSLANAGTITIGGGPHAASGVARAQCVTANDGTCTALQLPVGTYTALVEPPLGWPNAFGARSAVPATVSTAGVLTLQLAPALSIATHVQRQDGTSVANARVRARSRGNPLPVEQLTDSVGNVTLTADAGLPLELWVDAMPSDHLASAHRQLGDASSNYVASLPQPGTIKLGHSLTVSGVVSGSNNTPVASAVIDVLCPSCGDLTPLAHAETNGNGVYLLELPDPGLQIFDGGTD